MLTLMLGLSCLLSQELAGGRRKTPFARINLLPAFGQASFSIQSTRIP